MQEGKYQYRLKQINYDGSFKYSDVIEVEIGAPHEFMLYQNYPNPFSAKSSSALGGNPNTIIKYSIPSTLLSFEDGLRVRLVVYDVLGNEVATLVNEEKQPGTYEINFNSEALTSGIYFYQLRSGNFVETKKMVLIR